MVESHSSAAHAGPNLKAYLAVFVALAVFTAVSFVANTFAHQGTITHGLSFAVILAVAVVKAALVGAIFMHLKWDWGRLFFMIIPAFILATMFMLVLMPDIVLAWRQ